MWGGGHFWSLFCLINDYMYIEFYFDKMHGSIKHDTDGWRSWWSAGLSTKRREVIKVIGYRLYSRSFTQIIIMALLGRQCCNYFWSADSKIVNTFAVKLRFGLVFRIPIVFSSKLAQGNITGWVRSNFQAEINPNRSRRRPLVSRPPFRQRMQYMGLGFEYIRKRRFQVSSERLNTVAITNLVTTCKMV